ncbi:uncharacterized protein LOC144450365 [Glandiceps talaboti]
MDCSVLGIRDHTFIITDPSTYTISIGSKVEITFSIGLTSTNPSDDRRVPAIDLYFTDDTSVPGYISIDAFSSKELDIYGRPTLEVSVPANADGTTLTTGLMASITADSRGCSEYRYLCVHIDPYDDRDCIDVSSNIDCKVVWIKDDSFIVTSPSPYTIGFRDYVEITFTIGLINNNTDVVSVTAIYFDLTYGPDTNRLIYVYDTFPAGPSSSFPIMVAANADGSTTTTDLTARIILDDHTCYEYPDKLLCVVVYPGNDVECIDITSNTACPEISLKNGSFLITSPTTYTFSTDSAVEITFQAGFQYYLTTALDINITSVTLCLSDNVDLFATGTKVSDAIPVNWAPKVVAYGADGTADNGLATGMTGLVQIFNVDDCNFYNHLCLKVDPTDAIQCIDITGKTYCSVNNGASGVKVRFLTLIGASVIAMITGVIKMKIWE